MSNLQGFHRSENGIILRTIWSDVAYMSFDWAWIYIICSGVEIYHFVGRRDWKLVWELKYIIRSVSIGRASKYIIWSGVEIFHFVICHLVGRRNLSFGRVSKYVNWSGIEIFYLVRQSKYIIWSGVEIFHLVR